jgi:hypothetical protein
MQQELSSGCAGASQGIILCYRKNQLERDDLAEEIEKLGGIDAE